MPKYVVYIQQVNQARYEIEADSKEEARHEAKMQWLEDNYPQVTGVEEVKTVGNGS